MHWLHVPQMHRRYATQGSVESSRGARVKLDVSELPLFSFFPGQVCIVDAFT